MMCFFFLVAGWSLEVKKRTVALQDWKFNRDPRWEAKLLRILPLHQLSGVYFKVFSSTAIFLEGCMGRLRGMLQDSSISDGSQYFHNICLIMKYK